MVVWMIGLNLTLYQVAFKDFRKPFADSSIFTFQHQAKKLHGISNGL